MNFTAQPKVARATRQLLSATALASAVALFPGVAAAQTAPATATADDAAPQEVTVTGSRIRSPNAESNIPITSISGQQFAEQGRNSVGDALNDLPQLASTFSQANPGSGVGIAGLNLLDLRGLGTVRTVVLVNGRRHVGGDLLNNAISVDTNTIPSNLIDRVDLVTGGNSAVYGSDAVAGVVNFVLKQNYDGLEVRGNAGVTSYGFAANQSASLLAGKNFADGRGNVTFSAEYSHADRVYLSDIPWLRSVDNFIVTDVDPAGLANGSDGFPDRAFFRDIRIGGGSSPYGTTPINQRPIQSACGTGIGSTNGAPTTTAGVPYSCNYIFDANGRLAFQTGTKVSTGINATYIGGNGSTGREGQLGSVLPLNQRYNFNLLAHYEVSPALDFFFEGKWGRTTSQGNNSGTTFWVGSQTQFDSREKIRLDNPYLNAADRATLTNLILTSNCNPSFTVACPDFTNIGTTAAPNLIPGNLLPADLTAIANGSYRFALGKQLADGGLRDELAKRTTWRVVAGFRGTFWDDWNYEVSGNYGKMTQTVDKSGYVDKQRFMLSLDAGIDPANTAAGIQCRAKFDAAARVAFPNNATNQARLAADIAACVPYNPFGGLVDNSAATRYFNYNEHDTGRMEQFDVSGFIGGNTGKFFNLPGGPIRFVIGGEYRSERSAHIQDDFAGAGNTNALAGLGFVLSPYQVKEAYGEINVPLLKDLPFIEELSLNGAARVSSYNSSAGTVWTWNYGGDWAPVQDIRFRANYGRSVRAPNISETSTPLVANFAPSFQDPCRASNIGAGTTFRAANCAADLGALLTTGSFANQALYSLPVLSGSNPNLAPEKSDSWTFGTVITPRWIRNFTLSLDYFNIRVNGVITSVTAQTIANSCYDAPTLNNIFCANFTRYRGTGPGPLGEIPGQILGNSLIQSPLNFAKLRRKGVDTNLAYRFNIADNASVSTNLIYTHNIMNSNYTTPTDPTLENRILSELGTPKDEFVWDADLKIGEVTIGYRLHYISPMYINTYEDYNAINGQPPQNADYADIVKYPAVDYHNLRLQWDIKNSGGFGKSFQFYTGVDNLFDRHPPLGLTGTGAGSIIYDFRGRTFYAGFRAGF